ncbi:MAG: hypothetical protein AB1659_10615 [Thermodesulfobacteriota bacterium]
MISRSDERPVPYGFIESIEMGDLNCNKILFPENTLIIAGTDSRGRHSRYYKETIPQAFPVVSYAPVIGSLPVGMGFDIAIAALSLKRKAGFPAPESSISQILSNPVSTVIPLTQRSICCLTISSQKKYGMILMTGNS